MIVTRWQAPRVPDKEQVYFILESEGLEPYEEEFKLGTIIPEHRHPFDEIRMVLKGQLMMDIAGTKLLLRPGDKIIVPSNTKHSKKVEGTEACVCICANRTY